LLLLLVNLCQKNIVNHEDHEGHEEKHYFVTFMYFMVRTRYLLMMIRLLQGKGLL